MIVRNAAAPPHTATVNNTIVHLTTDGSFPFTDRAILALPWA